MSMIRQAIEQPFGISVFGSALLRVEPDIMALHFEVENTAEHPKDAFAEVRLVAGRVREFLNGAGVAEFGSSQMELAALYTGKYSEKQFVGYEASISFQALLRDLERTEDVVSGIVDAGATTISHTWFQTSRLKELRAQARRDAVAAARAKAELYAQETGVKLGRVLHIEDVNPESLRVGMHSGADISMDAEVEPSAFDPASISVTAAVVIAFAFSDS